MPQRRENAFAVERPLMADSIWSRDSGNPQPGDRPDDLGSLSVWPLLLSRETDCVFDRAGRCPAGTAGVTTKPLVVLRR